MAWFMGSNLMLDWNLISQPVNTIFLNLPLKHGPHALAVILFVELVLPFSQLEVNVAQQMADNCDHHQQIEGWVSFGFLTNQTFWHFPDAKIIKHCVFAREYERCHLTDDRKSWTKIKRF